MDQSMPRVVPTKEALIRGLEIIDCTCLFVFFNFNLIID